jgi:hypothetical protein
MTRSIVILIGAESMKTIYAMAATAAILISAGANAGTTVSSSSTQCRSSAYGPPTCTTTTSSNDGESEAAAQRPRQVSAAQARKEREAMEAREHQWEAFCKPTGVVDKYGVTRLQYTHDGCEFGISKDIESFAEK